jgi:hypothetical protein
MGNDRRWKRFLVHSHVGFKVTLAAILGLAGGALFGAEINVSDGRPLAKALELLTSRHGYVITYEDPRYVHDSDIKDVTSEVRRDLDQYEPGQAPKVFVPIGGSLTLSYAVSSETGQPAAPAALIQELIDVHNGGNQGGAFRLEQIGDVFHIVPSKVKDHAGNWIEQKSILDVPITLPEKDRSVMEMVDAIRKAVAEATKMQVLLFDVPLNLFMQRRFGEGSMNKSARDILMQTLNSTGKKLTWQLYYDPGPDALYLLTIDLLPDKPSPPE